MLERIAKVTWQRPKLMLALVGVFVVLAAALGRGVEVDLAGITYQPLVEVEGAGEKAARDAGSVAVTDIARTP